MVRSKTSCTVRKKTKQKKNVIEPPALARPQQQQPQDESAPLRRTRSDELFCWHKRAIRANIAANKKRAITRLMHDVKGPASPPKKRHHPPKSKNVDEPTSEAPPHAMTDSAVPKVLRKPEAAFCKADVIIGECIYV